jgi:hypothetical protein
MNGFQQAAALAPLPKYDKRYARTIAKWILNLTNASRLFYWNALPQDHQDSYPWASANDPMACIPHESMKEVLQGKTPFATGDAIGGGWAATNLSLYSGSGVGYLAAVVKATNIPEILQIDLNKTDLYGDDSLASYLYFNPTQESKLVQVNLPQGNFGVYESLTETVLQTAVSGSFQLLIPAGEVRLIRLFTSGLIPENHNGRLYAGDDVLDYHYQYDYTENLRIKALSTDQNPLLVNSSFTAFCEPGNVNPGDDVQFEWFMDDVLITGQNQSQATLTAPSLPEQLVLKCKISFNGQIAIDTLNLQVVAHIAVPPVVNGIDAATKYTAISQNNTFTASVAPAPGEILQYLWSVTSGVLNQTTGNTVTWLAPGNPQVGTITLTVTNQDLLSTTVTAGTLVKDTSFVAQTPLIWYPFDANNLNAVADNFHATASGVTKTDDSRGMPSLAYRFTAGQNIIFTENNSDLNFGNAISVSCWVKCEQLNTERFIISHGSWQQRYKLSITPEGRFRWTVKTDTGVLDLDGSMPIELNRYYHVTALYTGYSMELYVDGTLDTFKPFTGTIQSSTKPLTIGRMDDVETLYALRGSVDEVKLWDKEIPVSQIEQLKNQWATPAGIDENEAAVRFYPNPAKNHFYIELAGNNRAQQVTLLAPDGRKIADYPVVSQDSLIVIEVPQLLSGIYFCKIRLESGKMIIQKIVFSQ